MSLLPTKVNLPQLVNLTNKEVGLELPEEQTSKEQLHDALTQAVQYLIDHNFEKLMQVLYRIDVSEAKVKQAFGLEQNVAQQIARLIIEREEQKVITRAIFKNRD